jgi:MYXO-CTERM domain-containing protein
VYGGDNVRLLRGDTRLRSSGRALCVVLAALGMLASVRAVQTREEAPAALQAAQPNRSAHLFRAPEQVRLSFGQSPAPGSPAEVAVLSPKDRNLARGQASTSSVGVSQTLAPLRERGAYQVVYEVRLVDGNLSRGEYWFWYAPSSGARSWLSSPGPPGLALIAVAAALFALRRRRKTVVLNSARTAPTTTNVATKQVPAQRSPQHHEGLSPGSHPRPRSARVRQADQEPPEHSRRSRHSGP